MKAKILSVVDIHPTAVIAEGANIADNVRVGPFCVIDENVTINKGVQLHSHVAVHGRTTIGENTKIYPFCVIGAPPQHTGYRGEDTAVLIGRDNVIREHVTINLGTPIGRGVTQLGDRNFLMTGAHLGHDSLVGNDTILANNATLGGHVVINDNVFIGGLSAIHQYCKIGRYAFLGGCSAVIHDVIPFGSANGNYAKLAGLNIIGMKRNGIERDAINHLRHAYKKLFADQGSFQERMSAVKDQYSSIKEVQLILDFLDDEHDRPIMMA